MVAANGKSCNSNETSLKRNSDHLDAGTSAELRDSPHHAADGVIGDADRVSDANLVASDYKTDESEDKSVPGAAASVSERIDFTVVFMKEKFEMSLPSTDTVIDLKQLLGQCPFPIYTKN